MKTCETCGFRDSKNSVCQVFGHAINPKVDYCSKHATNIILCNRCKRPLLDALIMADNDGTFGFYCKECVEAFSTCETCKHATECDFETNPSSLPKVVQKQIRQGNMVTVTQIKNPDRIEITCKNGCVCYDAENGCRKHFNLKCDKYE